MAKETDKEIEDEVLEDLQAAQALLEEEEDFGDEDSDEESGKINRQQLLTLIGIAFLSFFIFTFFIFPFNEIVRSLLIRSGKETGIILDAKEIHFPIFGRKSFDSFLVSFPNGSNLKMEELSVSLSILGVLQSKLDGDAEIGYFKYEGNDWTVSVQSLILPFHISSFDEKITKWNGDGELEIAGAKILESMEIPFLGSLKGTDIKKLNLSYKIRGGKLLVEKLSMDSSLVKLTGTGVIRLSETISLSQLDLKLCFNLNEKFANERQDIAGMMALLPQEVGRTCVPLRGTISAPKVDLPNLNQLGGGVQVDEGSPTPANP
ncbi:MAG: type II secretion system protein GspN [Leptospira sp.]|nr:type II secretion system protein GspN [Leptospira sp.]